MAGSLATRRVHGRDQHAEQSVDRDPNDHEQGHQMRAKSRLALTVMSWVHLLE